jgi:hypothetical protein
MAGSQNESSIVLPCTVLAYDRYTIHSPPDHFLTVDDGGEGMIRAVEVLSA